MTAMREELHHLVDELPEDRVGSTLALVRETLSDAEADKGAWPIPEFVASFASGKGDLAERADEILRDELGRHLE